MKNIPKVVITNLNHWRYFQYFMLGFYRLEKEGKIKLSVKAGLLYTISRWLPENRLLGEIIYRINRKVCKDSYNLDGYIEYNNKRKYFCIDSADAPFLFDSKSLDRVDIYFKMQCPKEIDPQKGFPLTDSINIPYSDHTHTGGDSIPLTTRAPRKILNNLSDNINKIKPLVVGFRRIARTNSFRALEKNFSSYQQGALSTPSKKLMCYFGNALGPEPEKNVTQPDFDWERDIMGYYIGNVDHPNTKRAKAAEIIRNLGENYDARIISEGFADSGAKRHLELIVPLEQFCNHISKFEYNLNISGYRMSIPNRFMESFIVGTAIVTDKLSVKWYLPFDEEVVETTEMGYLPNDQVNWEKVKTDLKTLPSINRDTIIENFRQKWAPEVVAKYIVETVINAKI